MSDDTTSPPAPTPERPSRLRRLMTRLAGVLTALLMIPVAIIVAYNLNDGEIGRSNLLAWLVPTLVYFATGVIALVVAVRGRHRTFLTAYAITVALISLATTLCWTMAGG